MTHRCLYIATILLTILLAACYHNANLDFPFQENPKLVIEGLITNSDKPFSVKLSTTTNLNDSISGTPISDAVVQVFDNEGLSEELILVAPGLFESRIIKGELGKVYTLNVMYKQQVYSANDTLLKAQSIDSLYVHEIKDDDNFEDGKYIMAIVNIEQNTKTYSRVVLKVNDSIYNGYQDLLLFETSFLSNKAHIFIPYKVKSGDIVSIETYSLSKKVYDYWNMYYQITTGTLYTSLASSQNPSSDISGNCLGYFQVSAIKSYTIHVP